MTFYLNPKLPEHIGLAEVMKKIPLETEYGQIALKSLLPYTPEQQEQLKEAWHEIDVFMKTHLEHPALLKELRRLLHGLGNIRKALTNARNDDTLSDIDLFEIKKQVFAMERIRRHLNRHRTLKIDSLQMADASWLIKLLDPENTGIETFYLYDCYDPELQLVRRKKRELEERIKREEKRAEKIAVEVTGIEPLWNGELLIPKELPEARERLLELAVYDIAGDTSHEWIFRKRRHRDQDLMEDLLVTEDAAEQRVRGWLTAQIGVRAAEILKNTEALAWLDLLIGKTMLALKHRAVSPTISDLPEVVIKKGRHPVLEESLHKLKRSMVPIDLTMSRGATVITGANMGGKTMTLKMAALLTAMAQMGFWVPADQFCYQPVTFLYLSTGDEQSQTLGLSTFGAEIFGLNKVLDRVQENGLILLDELASGTNPNEGACISRAIVGYLSKSKAVSVVTTHYDGVGDLPGVSHLQVVGLDREALRSLKDKIQMTGWTPGLFEAAMDYRLQRKAPGVPVPKDAIAVAEIMGLKSTILQEARKWMDNPVGREIHPEADHEEEQG
jgi:DNA mismatch repair protein MutS2